MKNIRETIENNELLILSSRACRAAQSKGRALPETECEIRTCFQKDRDKIIHSQSFRRLKHKTQVFLAPTGDHYRTRLTHTLEVAQVARTIARALALNEDLTEAIALGHDLGHTPFGHTGETALNNFNPKGFRHYEQSVRVLETLENDGRGLNISKEILNGIITHTSGHKADTLEGQIVRIADKIAYINHDIDDAISAGIIVEDDIPLEFRQKFGFTKSERINTMVFNLLENSAYTIQMSPDYELAFLDFHKYMYDNIYNNPICKSEEMKAINILNELCNYFYKHSNELPDLYKKIANETDIYTAVCDYIASMSDFYAIRTFENLFIPKFWNK